jgi:large subunit ribosomal protein L21
MFAVVDIAGFQEKVEEGGTYRVPLHSLDAGKTLTLERVLLLVDGDAVTIGSPLIAGAAIQAEVIGHGRGEKIRVVKAKRRKRYRRVHGHKQDYTDIRVQKISLKS